MSEQAVLDNTGLDNTGLTNTGPASASANGATGHGGAASPGQGDVPGAGVSSGAGSPAPEVSGLVTLLTERALAISAAAAQQPSSVRISAGDVQVEICWQAASTVTAVPVSPPWPAAYPATGPAGWTGPVTDAGSATGTALAAQPTLVAADPGAPGGGNAVPGSDPAADAQRGKQAQQGVFALCAETVGTFYRAPEPGAAPFVTEGDQVRPGQQVGIIEAMKLMIPVEAQRAGEVVELLVADRAPVEYGQPLMLLKEAVQ